MQRPLVLVLVTARSVNGRDRHCWYHSSGLETCLEGQHECKVPYVTQLHRHLFVLPAQAVDMFLAIIGAEAGAMALRCLARGGVFIAGGIVPRLLDRVTKTGVLRDAFINRTARERFQYLLRSMPLYVVTNTRVGIIGSRWVGKGVLGVCGVGTRPTVAARWQRRLCWLCPFVMDASRACETPVTLMQRRSCADWCRWPHKCWRARLVAEGCLWMMLPVLPVLVLLWCCSCREFALRLVAKDGGL